jgi:RimJ/RimL family protein N-acetyltransferase
MKPIEFDTARLRIRQWRAEDYQPFAAINGDPKVMEYFPATLDRKASDVLADRLRAHIDEHGWGFWAVERLDTGEFIGFVGLQIPGVALPFMPCVEIGWRLAAAYWGQGFAAEAAVGALRIGFEQLQLAEIVSFTAQTNRRSRAVMERIGMQDTGVSFQHPSVPRGHVLRPHCLYLMSRASWDGRQQP